MTKSEVRNAHAENAFWCDDAESIVREQRGANRVYDLEKRTARFGEAIIDFAKTIPQNAVTIRITDQLVGAGTSIGANNCEADDAVSKKEFLKKCWNVPKGSVRNEALCPDDRSRSAGSETMRSDALA